jgi:hypothetical protein
MDPSLSRLHLITMLNYGLILTVLLTLVSCCPHRSLNSSHGVICCRELRYWQEDEIEDDLNHQGVVAAKELTSNRNRFKQQTNTVILIFNLPTPPTSVTIASYLKVQVQPVISSPLRCFKCKKYGHGSKSCSKPSAVCARCWSEDHNDSEMTHCVNDPTLSALTAVVVIWQHLKSAQGGSCSGR